MFKYKSILHATLKSMKPLVNWYLFFLPFLAFSNWFIHWNNSYAFVRGIKIDYLLPKLYAIDLYLIPLFIFALWNIFSKKYFKELTLFLLFLGVVVFTSHYFYNSLFFTISILFTGISFFGLYKVKADKKYLLHGIFTACIFQTLIAFYQWNMQTSLGQLFVDVGIFDATFYFFGEPNIGQIKTTSQFWSPYANNKLPLGTLPHTNILAGFLSFGVLTYLLEKLANKTSHSELTKTAFNTDSESRWQKILRLIIIVLTLITLLLTESVSAILAITITIATFLIIWKRQTETTLTKRILWIFITTIPIITLLTTLTINSETFSNDSISRRISLNQSGLVLLQENLLTGTGLNTFIPVTANHNKVTLPNTFLQPIHHTPWLFIVETGLIGLLLIAFLIYRNKDKLSSKLLYFLLFLSVIASLDHYLLTTKQGWMIVGIGIIFFSRHSELVSESD